MNLNDVDFDVLDEGQDVTNLNLLQNDGNSIGEEGYFDNSNPAYSSTISPDEHYDGGEYNREDVIAEFLKYNGISDLDHIKFEDEDGIVKDRSWSDLSFEEKMNILKTSQELPERDLDDDEIRLINDIRTSQLSPAQYIDTIQRKTVQDYVNSRSQMPQYSVNDLSDDEIFMLDLQGKVDDITDEELLSEVERAKKEDPLYERKVQGLRKDLLEREQAYLQSYTQEQQAALMDQYNLFKNSVLNSIDSLDKIGDLELNLENEDKEDVASFLLDLDDTGMSYFGKALNDPKTLVEMAWWTLKGRDAINGITEYFMNEIKNVRLSSFLKGLEEGRKASSKVVYKPQGQAGWSKSGSPVTIDDLY